MNTAPEGLNIGPASVSDGAKTVIIGPEAVDIGPAAVSDEAKAGNLCLPMAVILGLEAGNTGPEAVNLKGL